MLDLQSIIALFSFVHSCSELANKMEKVDCMYNRIIGRIESTESDYVDVDLAILLPDNTIQEPFFSTA